jgi:hypothetical protein
MIGPSPIPVDASSGRDVSVAHTLSGSATVTNPVGSGTRGQRILIRLTQGGGGFHQVTFDGAYGFTPGGLARPILKKEPGSVDLLGFRYDASKRRWLLVARGDHHGVMLPSRAWA